MPDDLTKDINSFRKIVYDILKENNIDVETLFNEEAARRLDYTEDKITDFGEKISEHLLKCLLFGPNDIDYNHWINEISGWLTRVYKMKLKTTNKFPDIDKIKKWLADDITDANNNLNIFTYKNTLQYLINFYTTKTPIGEKLLLKHGNDFLNLFYSIAEIRDNTLNIRDGIISILDTWFKKYRSTYK